MTRIKTVDVSEKVLALCNIKAREAKDMTIDETRALANWCDSQNEDLWDGMALQEILNVYRATAEWDTFEAWANEDWKAAYKAWNGAVIDKGNKMMPRHD